MGADYLIDWPCSPKNSLTPPGLLARVKAGRRAQLIREFYAQAGEKRAEKDMGFEMVYRTADGEQDVQILRVDQMESLAAELTPHAVHCAACPANLTPAPFGCIGTVNYPLSMLAEAWLLERLPSEEEPLPFLLLTKGQEMGNTGAHAENLRRNNAGVFFEAAEPMRRRYPEMDVTGGQMFELFFLLGDIPPKRAHMILLFMGAIPRDLQADAVLKAVPAPPEARETTPFLLQPETGDDASIRELKGFLHALYTAYLLNVGVLLDV
jgi:hypothetical protein